VETLLPVPKAPAPPLQRGLTPRDLLVALVMNLMWGMNLIAIKEGVNHLSPLTAAWLRQTMVLLFCLPALRIIPGKMRELLLLGICAGVIFYVLTNVSMAVADNVSALAIAGQLGSPIAVILGVIFLGERIHRYRIAGMALAFLGVALIVFDPAAVSERLGLIITAAGGFVWGICTLIQRRLAGVPVFSILAWMGCIGSLGLLPLALYFEPEQMRALPSVPLPIFGWVVFSALGSTILGQGAMSLLLRHHPLSTVVPLTLLSPVIAVIASTYYFGTAVTPLMLVGGVVALIGVAIVTVRTARVEEAEGRI
jgi:O-acetylserine/cysteine efflux transporter